MAITAAAVARTPYRSTFLCTHDGAAGDTLTLAASTLIAAAAGEMAAFLSVNWPGNNTANARAKLLGDNAGTTLTTAPYCTVNIRQRSGLTAAIVVDADVDAVNALQNELNITTSATAATFYLDVDFHHSLTR